MVARMAHFRVRAILIGATRSEEVELLVGRRDRAGRRYALTSAGAAIRGQLAGAVAFFRAMMSAAYFSR